MQGIVILPPDYQDFSGKLIFLAGPIQGAPDWQSEAIRIIQNLAPEVNIASPRKVYLDKTFEYAKQVDWETFHLRKAAETAQLCFGWRKKPSISLSALMPKLRASSWANGKPKANKAAQN
jgi:hypothetical protein